MVWCRKRKIYNTEVLEDTSEELWFDVENERYTTFGEFGGMFSELWFDVENERYTTPLM